MPRTPERVAIIGVAGHWGSELARLLERDPSVRYIAGIDTRPPAVELERTDFIEADIRSPLLTRLLPQTEVDTVVHCGIRLFPEPGIPGRALHEINVIGTLQLLAACDRVDGLERLVVRGSAAIYGCEGPAPSFFREAAPRRMPLRTRFQRDCAELEAYIENFARRHPTVACCTLRYQPEIGPGLDTPLVRYLSLPVVPVQLGYDPRLQLLHADDATDALAAATARGPRGAINVAPTGSISLSRILRLAGRPAVAVPHQLFDSALRRFGERELGAGGLYGDGVRLLRFGRGLDNSRLISELGFEPRYDAVAAVRDFAGAAQARRIGPSLDPGRWLAGLIEAVR